MTIVSTREPVARQTIAAVSDRLASLTSAGGGLGGDQVAVSRPKPLPAGGTPATIGAASTDSTRRAIRTPAAARGLVDRRRVLSEPVQAGRTLLRLGISHESCRAKHEERCRQR
jgi:hypothetical protein